MIMTEKLANDLMDVFACVAISANGGVPKNGLSKKQVELAKKYAQKEFVDLMKVWEETIGEEWEIEETKTITKKIRINTKYTDNAFTTFTKLCDRFEWYYDGTDNGSYQDLVITLPELDIELFNKLILTNFDFCITDVED